MATKQTQSHDVDSYKHNEAKRLNAIPAGVAPYYADDDGDAAHYDFDPNMDPRLEWSGKAEKSHLCVPIVGIHVHERMTSERVVRALLADWVSSDDKHSQGDLFESDDLRRKRQADSLEAYLHSEAWANRLIAGDSLLVMNSLLHKESMAGKVQCVYMDPPYGISYGSNFQAFTGKRDVKDKKDEDLPYQPEMVKAFRDTWELGIHSYLTYIRERLLVARELLADTGSCFVQIGDENVHLVRCVMDEVFGRGNCVGMIVAQKTSSSMSANLDFVCDYIVWYAKDKTQMKYHQLYLEKSFDTTIPSIYNKIELADGTRRSATKEEKQGHIPEGARLYTLDNLTSARAAGEGDIKSYEFKGKTYTPGKGTFKSDAKGLANMEKANRLEATDQRLGYIRYLDDFPAYTLNNMWIDTSSSFMERVYVVQTTPKVIARCLLMTTTPGDLVLDPTCGSGTTAYVAEQWGRRWITCDTSRVALTLAEKRLSTATYDWYVLNKDGVVSSGFKYKTVPHVTLKSIANGEEAASEVLYDKPLVDKTRVRVAGPFTVEALPAPVGAQAEVAPLVLPGEGNPAPMDAQRDAERSEVEMWCEELRQSGVLSRGGERLMFNRVAVSDEYDGFQAEAETADGRSAAVMFAGARYTMDAGRVGSALAKAQEFSPRPQVLLFAAFEFAAEAERYISAAAPRWKAKYNVTVLHTLMNNDLLTRDLRKGVDSSMSFFMVGQPDVVLRKADGDMYQVEVRGFDYFSVAKGNVISGGTDKIAMWMLDTDYDGLAIRPAQVFFPMDGDGAWRGVARALRAEVDAERMEAFKGCISLPFKMRDDRQARVAVKIVDDRGIESMRVLGREAS